MFGGRRKRRQEEEPVEEAVAEPAAEPAGGPYDAAEAPEDGLARIDLGSLRLPVPEGAQVQVEVDRTGPVRAVHLVTADGQLTVTAFAAPRSGGLWAEVARELVARLRTDGAKVGQHSGEWGREVSAVTPTATLRFVGVDGPRWMLRGVAAAGPRQQPDALAEQLRDVVRDTVVVRGPEPLPVRSALPLELPEPLAQQLKQAATKVEEGGAAPGTGR